MKTFIFVYAVLFFQPLAFGKEAPASKLVTIDVRSDSEFAESHLEGARHMDINSAGFRELAKKMDKSASYQLYCKSGGRSARAAQVLKEMGFEKVENLGGIKEASQKSGIKCVPKACP